MRIFFALLPAILSAVPLNVPTKFYEGHAKYPDHPGNAPLISNLTFRAICDHVVDNGTEWFDPDKVQQGDTIYLNIWYLEWFNRYVHDQIKHPYILITCDVIGWLPDKTLQKLIYDPKLTAWFCRNILFSSHPKIFQIPMGQTDPFFGYGWLPTLKEMCDQKPYEKKHFLYMNHYPREYGDRNKIVQLFEDKPYCFSRNHSGQPYIQINKDDYYKELAASTFVISPFGLESDCVRTWEAIALGCIPIIEHSFLDPLFKDMPVLMVHDWKEIDEEFLKKKYEELKDKRWDKAFFDSWENQILETQKKIRQGQLASGQLEAMKWTPEDVNDLLSILEEEGNSYLIYKGFLSAIHALDIAKEASFLSTIYLSDPWIMRNTFSKLINYIKDPSLMQSLPKIVEISEPEFYKDYVNFNPFGLSSAPIFLDFSYYRSSIVMDFTNFRHNLLNDLEDLYQQMMPDGLLIGNGIDHIYVSEALERFSQRHQIKIERRGSFWFFRRP